MIDTIVQQMRDGRRQLIKDNPSIVTWSRYPLFDNGQGIFIPDTTADPVDYKEVVKIAHEESKVQENSESPIGLSTSFSLYVVMMYDSQIIEGDIIKSGERYFKVGAIDDYKIKGKVYGKHAALTEVLQ